MSKRDEDEHVELLLETLTSETRPIVELSMLVTGSGVEYRVGPHRVDREDFAIAVAMDHAANVDCIERLLSVEGVIGSSLVDISRRRGR